MLGVRCNVFLYERLTKLYIFGVTCLLRTGSEGQQSGLPEHGGGRGSPGFLTADRALPRTL